MPATPFRPFTSRFVALPRENIDSDQIIPERFRTTTESAALGRHAFHDWRYLADGASDPAFPLHAPGAVGARILVAGRNFGCGSPREHAVWALQGAGFDVVVSSQFADTFRGNALANRLLPIEVSARMLARLTDVATSSYMASLAIDLESQTVQLPDGDVVTFPIAPFAKHCLLEGIGEMDYQLGATGEIKAFSDARP
jgi:3-isopropylmalate/(R)-2-methylmalate dehydratase small subunit